MKYFLLFILLTSSLNAEWTLKKLDFNSGQIDAFYCLDSNNHYIFTSHSFKDETHVHRSTNQGNSWNKIVFPDRDKDSVWNILNGMVFDTSNIYITYISRAVFDRSSDGGKTFKRYSFGKFSLEDQRLFNELIMYNKDIGVGFSFANVFITKDSWKTYTAIKNRKYSGAPMFFIDSNNVAIAVDGYQGPDYYSLNLTTHKWNNYYKKSQNVPGEKVKSFHRIDFVNDSVGFGIGSERIGINQFSKDIIWKTTDKGRSWNVILSNLHEPKFGLSDVAFKDEKQGIATGAWGKLIRTIDGGKTWEYIKVHKDLETCLFLRPSWKGKYPVITFDNAVYRLEPSSEIKEKKNLYNNKINVKYNQTTLFISINNISYQLYRIQIVDLLGNIHYDSKLRSSEGVLFNPIDLSNYQSGSYFYRIMVKNKLLKAGNLLLKR